MNMENRALSHFGVKGMKWGVRKYQESDGSYTKKGLARYGEAQSEYDKAKAKSTQTKAAYKSGSATSKEYKTSKAETKASKQKLKTEYKKLKTDNAADKGRELYKQGKTISGNTRVTMLNQLSIVAGSKIAAHIVSNASRGNEKLGEFVGATIFTGGTAVNAILAAKTRSENKKLRAYYAH